MTSSTAIAAAQSHFLQFRIQWASIVLLYYDYALTFRSECKYIWRAESRTKPSTILYIFCRYALVANVLYLLAVSGKLGSNCDVWYKFIGALSVLGRASVIAVFTMRTYAVCAQSRIVLLVLGTLGLTCIVLDCLHVPGLRCHGSSSIQIANTLLSILVCVFEFTSASLTLFRSIQALSVRGICRRERKRTFNFLVLEQGNSIFIFTTAAVILNFRAANGFPQRLLNAFTLPLSGLLTARFLLHIRSWDSRLTSGSIPTTTSMLTTPEQEEFVSTFQAIERALVDDFGKDPVTMMADVESIEDGAHMETEAEGSARNGTQGAHDGESEGTWGSLGDTMGDTSRSRSRARTYASESVAQEEEIEMGEIVERERSRSPCRAPGSDSSPRRRFMRGDADLVLSK
ncbi:uncharacterized protein STEHIDRAFT_132770 [Stereum hirsutum FP-91666 SS1]|uniref:uncharacterized protein n=1 Tax=Stereum hirsutum (strain FP-91666) TaxID=721885 RepID=UPI0004449CCE|nr:uncharacterized protein STEHIDRAFT_132770 [Stereum hirsutum FP-91666 SS1]EIM84426.1 hypothetical protein STEHIDRAFT_132770 [Stereum hirsutum FP-91666 SS1]